MKLIVGLGNPGKEYINTRHNCGYIAIEEVANKYNLEFNKKKFDALYCEFVLNNEKIILLKPLRYMNLSGDVLYEFMNYFKINIEDLLVICDDMSLEIGDFKLRYKGGNAGHNGLKNIENNFKTNEYKRIKIGISKNNIDMANYVLGKFTNNELNNLNKVIKLIPDIINDYTIMSFDNLMNKYNKSNR